MPDALSKTIPIWCSVLNRVLFPDNAQCHELYAPPQVVSQSEYTQMTALLPSFVNALLALKIPITDLQSQISKPLRPMWLTPGSNIESTSTVFEDFHPIICCTVSRRVAGVELSEGGYIQGAGDDTENWAHGLTPTLFWENKDILLSTAESELPDLIGTLVDQAASAGGNANQMRVVQPTSQLFVVPNSAMPVISNVNTCTVNLLSTITDKSTWQTSPTRIDVGLGPHKIGSRNLRAALPFIVDFVERRLRASADSSKTKLVIVVACESGKDLSIGVALAILCLFFNKDGEPLEDFSERERIDKDFIRRRLGWCSTSMPDANPSRATIQSINSYLMERPK